MLQLSRFQKRTVRCFSINRVRKCLFLLLIFFRLVIACLLKLGHVMFSRFVELCLKCRLRFTELQYLRHTSSSSSLCTLSTSCWISVSFSSSLSSSLSASRSSTSSSCNFSLPYVWSNFFNSSLAAVSSFLDFCTNSSTALSLSALAALASCALL
eukprot:GHVQ01023567.1.p1 GENE.GHVQ01023567.1~~GHVQ01023567.1.p1  ORF type:complete len:155 (+),score=17.27 GHVQ01023567.1:355-819(+)